MGWPEIATFEIETTVCYRNDCDATITMPREVMVRFRKNHESFYCYRGHGQAFLSESKEAKLKRQLEEKQRQIDRKQKELEWAREGERSAQRSAAAYRGQVTKIKKRVGNGVCPCCNRTFQDLGRHMKTKHPTYKGS